MSGIALPGFSPATYAEGQKAYELLASLDVHGNERRELLAAGVPLHRVETLYPSQFSDLFPGLHRYFDRYGVRHLSANVPGERDEATNPNWWLDKPQQSRWMNEHVVVASNPHMRSLLENRIHDELGGDVAAYMIRDTTIKLLWGAWWLPRNLELLRPQRALAAYGLVHWVVGNLLPGLEIEESDADSGRI